MLIDVVWSLTQMEGHNNRCLESCLNLRGMK
jgi:hypothetical protein